jgi:hypothetical protein
MFSMAMPAAPPAAVSPEKVTDCRFVKLDGGEHVPNPVF